MSLEPDVALEKFLEAVRAHYAAASRRASDSDPRVEASYMELADAFELYEDALYTAFDEVTPFELFDDVEDAKDNADLDDEADEDDDDDDFEDDLNDEEDDYLDDDEIDPDGEGRVSDD
ncbi:hypothetical protein [Brevibacterium litoralis]|uniref:hypothetical protein n=1 Tax=Brevibacterium litoralis TaxID=3138935 RepID=UPI0032ED1FA7